MKRVRPFAELMFLAILAAMASPTKADPGTARTSLVHAARLLIPAGSDPGLLQRAPPVVGDATASNSENDSRPETSSRNFRELSGGPTGTLLIGAALVAALALILAVVIPW